MTIIRKKSEFEELPPDELNGKYFDEIPECWECVFSDWRGIRFERTYFCLKHKIPVHEDDACLEGISIYSFYPFNPWYIKSKINEELLRKNDEKPC